MNKSTQSNTTGQKPGEQAPIIYDGKEINDIHDLIKNFKLDNYEEAKRKREL